MGLILNDYQKDIGALEPSVRKLDRKLNRKLDRKLDHKCHDGDDDGDDDDDDLAKLFSDLDVDAEQKCNICQAG